MSVVRRRRRTSGKRVILSDTFTRADNAASIGSAETGQLWTATVGSNWGVIGGQAYAAVPGGGYTFLTADLGVADYTIQANFYTITAGQGIRFRHSDNNNGFMIEYASPNFTIWKEVAGVFTNLIGNFAYALANGDLVGVMLAGNSIKIYVNNVLIASASDAFNNTATRAGLSIFNSSTPRWDNVLGTVP